jgi:hypothetical protein
MKKLDVGMRSDETMVDQIPGSWRHAQNMITNRKNYSVSNEEGADNITPTIGGTGTTAYPSTKKMIGEIKYQNDRILFFATTVPEDSEMGRIKEDGKYYPIIKDATSKVVLNLNENYPVNGTAAKKYNDNVIVSWTDVNDNLCLLNIDVLPFKVDTDFTVNTADVAKAKTLIKLFPQFLDPIPQITLTGSGLPSQTSTGCKILEGLGSLTTGTYHPFMRYKFPDGTYTSFTKVYNGIPLSPTSLGGTINTLMGGEIGDATGKSIELVLTNIDTNYQKIQVGYLHVAGNITRAYIEKDYKINNNTTVTVQLDGSNRTEITLEEVLTPNSVYKKVESITSLQNTLYLGGVEYDDEFDFQDHANTIDVKWTFPLSGVNIYHDVSHTGRDNYASGSNAFLFKSFKWGECYAFYIRFKLTNGLYSKAFHIPGRVANSGDRDVMNPDLTSPYAIYNALDGNNPVYKYQVKNTHTTTNTTIAEGTMSYWENEDEEYPLDPTNPSNIHPKFASIPGITTSDRKVRHHQFPDMTALAGIGTGYKFVNEAGVSPNKTLSSVPLGVKFTINIPSGLIDQVDTWEILYAERNNTNIRILASDLATTGYGSNPVRFNHFDLMISRPGLVPSYIKPLASWGGPGAGANQNNFIEALTSNSMITSTDPNLFHNVSTFNYVGANTTVPINNTGFSDCIAMNVSPVISSGFDCNLYDICLYKRNVYMDFNNQNLVSSGYTKKATSGIQNMVIYGGDVYVNRHSVETTTGATIPIFHYICESVSNIALRKEDLTQNKFFAPKSTTPSDSWFGYDSSYNAINKFNIPNIYFPEDNGFQDATKFPSLIAKSLTETTEGKSINWRTFKVNSYYIMPKDKGKIISILGNDRIMYIQHEFSLFIAEIKDSLKTSDGAEIASLGVTDLFDRPPIEVNPIKSGRCGSQSKFANILCDMGYVSIDRQKGWVNLVPHGSTQAITISDHGMYKFWRDHGQTVDTVTDNPFIGKGYTIAYDSLYKRLIICKMDATYPFTISYSPTLNESRGGWLSFHTYSPNFISENRLGLVVYENTQKKVFKHNSTTLKSTFYDSVAKESFIDVVFNENPEITKTFDNANWISTVENATTIFDNETATHLIAYTGTKCTDKIDLAKSSRAWYSRDSKNVEGTWNFNNFRDMVIDPSLPFLDSTPQKALISSNISTTKSWYNKSKFLSKFAVFRLIYSNVVQKDFHLNYVGSNYKRSNR